MGLLAKGTPRWIILLVTLCYSALAYVSCLYTMGYRPYYIGIYVVYVSICTAVFTLLTFFFRDPERSIGDGVVSPADGRVMYVGESTKRWYEELNIKGRGYKMVSIFMNIHDVHVNRSPVSGRVIDIKHIEGRYFPAFSKESEYNERAIITINSNGNIFYLVLIAGFFARRIVIYVKKGQYIKKGERLSLIRFGSRVDLHIPKGYRIVVQRGVRVKAGTDTIAELSS